MMELERIQPLHDQAATDATRVESGGLSDRERPA